MSQGRWTAVDDYSDAALIPPDRVLEAALQASADAGLPDISVSPAQGKMLHLLALCQGASRILEIGTLGGYSTIWLARALPSGGRLITLEADPRNAEVARSNLANAGLADVCQVRLGPALDTLPLLHAAGDGPFDLIFIDADKPSYPDYLAWSVRLSRPGSMIVADNVVRGGDRCREHAPWRPGSSALHRGAGRRAAGERHRDPDRGPQGLRRLRARRGPGGLTRSPKPRAPAGANPGGARGLCEAGPQYMLRTTLATIWAAWASHLA
jgi:predicted O-methyltransferase YrrM